MPGNFYNGTDAELLSGSANFSALITAGATTYGLVAAQATAYAALSTAYASAYEAANEPSTRTSITVATKNAARKALRDNSRLLGNIIESTPTVTDAQLLSLGLNTRTSRTPIPPPANAPGIVVLATVGNTVKLRLFDPPDAARRGKPEGVNGASVFSYVGPVAPTDESEWNFEGVTGRTRIDIAFPSSTAPGSRVWFTAFWFNGRKQNGPAATPVSTNIPGGSAMAA